ncbi:UNVERIFIED_CONTAM: putative LRR receptor-like serine/threonine-protein kinase [Sesamum radiatum]|uniref:non-specific serine/threonine protein kinase n=1 Tax=Sesamum radiatum TaxID=300843 RepID=A0AAW2LQ12_SESRA
MHETVLLKQPMITYAELRGRISDMKESVFSLFSLSNPFPMFHMYRQLKGLNLTGSLPVEFASLSHLRDIDLQGTSMEGPIPATISRLKNLTDLRISDLKGPSMSFPNLQNMNDMENLISWCLKPDIPCSRKPNHHSLFINCGGRRISFESNEYEENLSGEGPSHFESYDGWAYSSTGVYMGNDNGRFIATNVSSMASTGAEFYQTARLSPSSLKYFGLCLRKGSYNYEVYTKFQKSAEYNDNSILEHLLHKGNVVLTDFDIVKEANGVSKGIYRDFNAYVNGSTLEIHLYWTGKGTTAIPDRGVYGPLISAIAVTPTVLWMKVCRRGKAGEDNELRGLDLQTGYFTLRQIKAATNNFNNANKIGEGGFGPVYKGVLSDGTVIAVKQLSSKSKQGNREFVNEIGMISALQHPNLVKLFGCCIEGNQLLLIYEYLENNCLARALFGRQEQRLNLDWPTRKKICLGIAKGLAYLHEESRLKIVHRDIKATNVLLDKDLNAKISDFGLAKLDEEENTHISTRIAGTIGYMAPEYAMRGYLTDKADVYSFGIVALEIVSGKSNTNYRPKEEFVYLLDWV